MFNWLLGKKKKKNAATAEPSLANDTPTTDIPAVETTSPSEVADLPVAPTANVPRQQTNDALESATPPANTSSTPQAMRPLACIKTAISPPKPRIGMAAVEHAYTRTRDARITGVQAGGRRVLASLNPSGRAYAYTLDKDGCYRLEGNKSPEAPQLVIDAEC